MTQGKLSPQARLCALLLSHIPSGCDIKRLAFYCGKGIPEARELTDELARAGMLLQEAESGMLHCTGAMPPAKQLRHSLEATCKKAGEKNFLSALCLFTDRQYTDFLEEALDILTNYGDRQKNYELFCAYEFFAGLILKISLRHVSKDFNFNFIDRCMKIQKMSFNVPYMSKLQALLFYKIRGAAFIVGDKRSLGFIDVHIGSLNITLKNVYDTAYYKRMKQGYQTILSIGDKDIILRTADKIILYYITESKFNEGLAFFYSYIFLNDDDLYHYINVSMFLYAAACATYTGNFILAERILEYGIKRIPQIKKNHLSYDDQSGIHTMRSMTAFLLVSQGRYEEALNIIDSVLTQHDLKMETYASLWAARALAFYHYRQGNIEKSWHSFREWMTEPKNSNLVHSNYFIATFVLDLLCAYQLAGHSFAGQWLFRQELEFAIASPFLILRANALRIAGQLHQAQHGVTAPETERYFTQSLELFRGINAPVDMAKTLRALSELHLAQGNTDAAAAEIAEAQAISRCFAPSLFSDLPVPPQDISEQVFRKPDLGALFACALKTSFLTDLDGDVPATVLGALMSCLGLFSGFVLRCSGGRPESGAVKNHEAEKNPSSPLFKLAMQAIAVKHRLMERAEPSSPCPSGFCSLRLVFHISLETSETCLFCLEGTVPGFIHDMLHQGHAARMEELIAACIAFNRKMEKHLAEADLKAAYSPQPLATQHEMVFASDIMKKIVHQVDTVARKDTSVLLLGESGCGKEALAHRLHEKSQRPGSVICVNLSNMPYELFESECFGYEKGSFTGAVQQKIGLFELANDGTLFIDEIGDMPLGIQVKLLRVLQNKSFMRIGGTKNIYSNFRLICATNVDLEKAVREGRFREDLYYRINVVTIKIPPLRERKEDITLLVQHFSDYYSKYHSVALPRLGEAQMQKIVNYPWPGNIRQIKNYVERFCILHDTLIDDIAAAPVPQSLSAPERAASAETGPLRTMQDVQDEYFERAYLMTAGNVGGKQGLAALLGISRSTAYAWIERLQLTRKYRKELRLNEDA